MDKIMNSITKGILKLNETKEKYGVAYDDNMEKKETYEVTSKIMGEENSIKMRNLENRVSAIETRIQYINFIIKELEAIKNFIEVEEKADFNNHCLYFGSGNLYYSNLLLELSETEIFETMLNNIIHYTGSLYVINNKDIRLSYVLTALGICLGKDVNFKDGKTIYQKHHKECNFKILDINKHFRDFVIRNKDLLGFFKYDKKTLQGEDIYLTYRVILGNNIKIQNMFIKVVNNRLNISEVNTWNLMNSKTESFKLA